MENTEILENLYSVDINEWSIVDTVYLNSVDTNAVQYSHCEGYFYSDNFNEYWIADPYDFEIDEDENITMPNSVWLKSK